MPSCCDMGSGNDTHVLTLMKQALHSLRHSPTMLNFQVQKPPSFFHPILQSTQIIHRQWTTSLWMPWETGRKTEDRGCCVKRHGCHLQWGLISPHQASYWQWHLHIRPKEDAVQHTGDIWENTLHTKATTETQGSEFISQIEGIRAACRAGTEHKKAKELDICIFSEILSFCL